MAIYVAKGPPRAPGEYERAWVLRIEADSVQEAAEKIFGKRAQVFDPEERYRYRNPNRWYLIYKARKRAPGKNVNLGVIHLAIEQ